MNTKKLVIKAYKRSNKAIGIRNHIIVMSSVSCVNNIVQRIASLDKSVIPITHQHGCDHMGHDREQVLRTLSGICNNPNVGGILLVGLGCENITVNEIYNNIDLKNKIARKLEVQEIGDPKKIIENAKKHLRKIKKYVSKQKRQKCELSELVIGVECGGSDELSGKTANPAVGVVSDKVVELGGTIIFSEIPEMIGAEEVLAKRIKDEKVKKKLFEKINHYVNYAKEHGQNLEGTNPSPGNIRAGLDTIEKKSLGAIAKSGTSEIKEVVDYAASPKEKGLVIMDTPGNDPESVTGMSAGGACVILFTTGLGTPAGNPVAPIIKISSNSKTFSKMKSFIDINAGKVQEASSVAKVGEEIFKYMIDVCNGKQTLAERNKQYDFAINRTGPTF